LKATTATAPTIASTATSRKPTSLCLTKYIKNIQQANRRTALEYEYRLSKFDKYLGAYQQQDLDRKIKAVLTQQEIMNLERQGATVTEGECLAPPAEVCVSIDGADAEGTSQQRLEQLIADGRDLKYLTQACAG
jgi:hypothetical protein